MGNNMDPIKLSNTEIISLDYDTKVIGLLIHHSFGEEERKSKEAAEEFLAQKRNAVNYLVWEGFILNFKEIIFWKCSISGVYHQADPHE